MQEKLLTAKVQINYKLICTFLFLKFILLNFLKFDVKHKNYIQSQILSNMCMNVIIVTALYHIKLLRV